PPSARLMTRSPAQRGEALEQRADPVDVREPVPRGGRPRDHRDPDADAAVRERAERVLVRDVIADVERDDVRLVEAERLEEPEDRAALVPLHGGPQLEHLLA